MKLFTWAEKGPEPLQSYATGLLAAAMELQDLAANFREQNAYLVPIMLKRLWEIQKKSSEEKRNSTTPNSVPRRLPKPLSEEPNGVKTPKSVVKNRSSSFAAMAKQGDEDAELMPGPVADDQTTADSRNKGKGLKKKVGKGRSLSKSRKNSDTFAMNSSIHNDSSNSSWAEMESFVIGN